LTKGAVLDFVATKAIQDMTKHEKDLIVSFFLVLTAIVCDRQCRKVVENGIWRGELRDSAQEPIVQEFSDESDGAAGAGCLEAQKGPLAV
jgi:hypothetical protein